MDATGWDSRYAGAELVWSAEPNRTVADITAALTDLDIERAERIDRPVEVAGRQRTAIDTLVRAVRPEPPR